MLDRRAVARLLVKLGGLLIALYGLISLFEAANLFVVQLRLLNAAREGLSAFILLTAFVFASPLVYLIGGLGVMWWAQSGTARAPAADDPPDASGGPRLADIEATLIAILGIYFLCEGLSFVLATAGSMMFNVIVNRMPVGDANRFLAADYGAGLVRLVIGMLLIMRREGIAALRGRIPEWVRSARRWPT